jgi:hypothetical protein
MIKQYLNFIKNQGIVWDLHDKFMEISNDPIKFQKEFKRIHSKILYELLFTSTNQSLLLISHPNVWIKFTVEWVLKNGPITIAQIPEETTPPTK